MSGPDSKDIFSPPPVEIPPSIERNILDMRKIFRALIFEEHWKNPEGKKVLVAGCGWTAYEIDAIFSQQSHGEVVLLDSYASDPASLRRRHFPKLKFSFIPKSLYSYFTEDPLEQFNLITFIRIPDLGYQLTETHIGGDLLEEITKRLRSNGLFVMTGNIQKRAIPNHPQLTLLKQASLSNLSSGYLFGNHRGFLFKKKR